LIRVKEVYSEHLAGQGCFVQYSPTYAGIRQQIKQETDTWTMLHSATNLITEAVDEVLQGSNEGRVIAQAGFEPRSDHVGFVVDEVALGEVFSEYFCFPLLILIPLTAPRSSIV
jgi:hypothetical protein